jgi:hypothetical protein
MATPYPNVTGKDGKLKLSKDNYNFYHSQLCMCFWNACAAVGTASYGNAKKIVY